MTRNFTAGLLLSLAILAGIFAIYPEFRSTLISVLDYFEPPYDLDKLKDYSNSDTHKHYHRLSPVSVSNDQPKIQSVYFNKPDALYYQEPTEIKLDITKKPLSDSEIESTFSTLDGKIATKTLAVGSYITAKLSAPSTTLEIEPANQNEQITADDGDIYFTWYVRPLVVGDIIIRLDIYSQDNASTSVGNEIQVMQEKWIAKAKGLNEVRYWIASLQPISAAISALAAAIGAVLTYFGWDKWFKKAKEPATGPKGN